MTENQEAIEVATQETVEAVNESEVTETNETVEDVSQETNDADSGEDVEFPQKAVNALKRKNKTINKLRAQMQELEAKLNEVPKEVKIEDVNEEDYTQFGDFINAQVEALVNQKLTQSQSEMQKQQLEAQKKELKAQRDQYIIEQAQELSQTLTDLPQVFQQHVVTLDSLPEQIADIFYSIDNAPAAIYTLAKEGKLEGLRYANPALAAYEIVNAQNRGMELLSKPQQRVSQAPAPLEKAKGTGTVKTKKDISQLSGKELLERFAK